MSVLRKVVWSPTGGTLLFDTLAAMMYLYTSQQVRDAEWPLLNEQVETDQLMRQAADRVADVARVMLASDRPGVAESDDVLLLVGPGGNGGDALYAGAELAGVRQVHALLVADQAHTTALEAFQSAGGVVLQDIPLPHQYRLIIDGIAGLGAGRALDEPIAELAADALASRIPILSIDVPSGVAADSGLVPDPVIVHARGFDALDAQWAVQRVPSHITATVTVTFGGLRIAHGVAGQLCGQVVVVDLDLPRPGRSLADELLSLHSEIRFYQMPSLGSAVFDFSSVADLVVDGVNVPSSVGEALLPGRGVQELPFAGEPQPDAHKYSGGVVTVCAGSDTFPGAGQLCALSAMKATSFGVRFVGDTVSTGNLPPEIVRVTDLVHRYRSHAYAVGPGRGVGDRAALELDAVLATDDPVVLDADAISILATNEDLQNQLRHREGLTVLTPHEGEFARLAQNSVVVDHDGDQGAVVGGADDRRGDTRVRIEDRVSATVALAGELNCFVLLKGRSSIIASPKGAVTVVEAGCSWAATPGSGDVLTGIMGAYVARVPGMVADLQEYFPELQDVAAAQRAQFMDNIVAAVIVHCTAARLGARTEFGAAPISASDIAAAIPVATAYLGRSR